jgi:LAO/AO transport system kinase
MKAGLMEIADIFVVNKSDRPDAATFQKNLRQMLAPAFSKQMELPIIPTVAQDGKGIPELMEAIHRHIDMGAAPARRSWLLAEKAYELIRQYRMQDIDRAALKTSIEKIPATEFQLYRFVEQWLSAETHSKRTN